MELSRDAARDARSIHRGLEAMQRVRLRARWSGLPVVIHLWRQSEPGMHRLLPDRVAGWRKGRWIKRANRDPTDGRVAISLPIQRAAAIRAEMKSNAIAAVGVALVNPPLTMEPYPLFRITGTEMESGASAALARLAVAQVDPIRFTRGNYSKRPQWHCPICSTASSQLGLAAFWPIIRAAVEPLLAEGPLLSGSGNRD